MAKIDDIGLDILYSKTKPGQRRTQEEIAAYAGITKGGIYMAEKKAMQKLRRKLHLHEDPVLRELCKSFFKL